MSEHFIKPEQTAAPEYSEEIGADGERVTVCVEHYRQGDHCYRITWRSDAAPVVEDESAPIEADGDLK